MSYKLKLSKETKSFLKRYRNDKKSGLYLDEIPKMTDKESKKILKNLEKRFLVNAGKKKSNTNRQRGETTSKG